MRTFLVSLILGFVGAVSVGCAGAPCDETRTVPVYAPERMAAAPACASCAGGMCAAPLAAPAPLGVVGEYGIELGAPGAPEHVRAAFAVPPAVAGCLVTGAYDVLMAAIKAANCAAANLIPTPAASQRLVRLQMVERAKQAGPCGK